MASKHWTAALAMNNVSRNEPNVVSNITAQPAVERTPTTAAFATAILEWRWKERAPED